MNPNKLNTLLLTTTIIGTILSFICMFTAERWYISAIMFLSFAIGFFVAMDRRENLRKGVEGVSLTNAELLERVKQASQNENGYFEITEDEISYLVEEVENIPSLESYISTLAKSVDYWLVEGRKRNKEITRLRETLEFYADSMLNGSEARKALEGDSK